MAMRSRYATPRDNSLWYLIPAEEYETFQEIIEDEREQRAIHALAMRNAGRRCLSDADFEAAQLLLSEERERQVDR